MTVGEKIKQRRIELGLSQDELAKKVGYKSRSSINKIELARDLPLKKVQSMAYALDLSVSYLMGWDEEKEIKPSNSRQETLEFVSNITKEQKEKLKDVALVMAYLSQLNEEGLARATEQIKDLALIQKYTKDDNE